MNTRWQSDAGDVTAWLDASHRTPRLVVTWGEVAGWCDEGAYAFEVVLAPRSIARRVIAEFLGDASLASISNALAALRQRAGEQPGTAQRTWSRTISRGFCAGDLDEVDSLVVSADGVSGGGYTHSYGQRSGEASWSLAWADFVDPRCEYRAAFAECLPRIDPYVRLCMAASAD